MRTKITFSRRSSFDLQLYELLQLLNSAINTPRSAPKAFFPHPLTPFLSLALCFSCSLSFSLCRRMKTVGERRHERRLKGTAARKLQQTGPAAGHTQLTRPAVATSSCWGPREAISSGSKPRQDTSSGLEPQ